ncbi:(d)CMP kinase [Vagococcus intermedius]|uniref:Cytidylate kinase n=1 Tax=Vagococcus intermedius TaxID=2991418 RepID=A0AAF0I8L1_9ENTE|nr:(d)CMP kinase [Vagococcus intermedius]WEG74264.1 (d)CMP kinase [Vagococcus intermedius]WEG76346.1 (d)CMP kinase [Vagococcus intermedius]
MKKISIAIDGPASAGKSTVAKILAKQLNYIYLDTGAMYRAITLATLKNKIDPADESQVKTVVQASKIHFEQSDHGQLVFLNNQDVTEEIRLPEVTNLVSQIAAQEFVRQELVRQQQSFGAEGGIVMDGRDIGTAVLPNAEVKIFLVASVVERAERRYQENISKGIMTDFETLKKEIEERDYKDSTRVVSPLVQASDAVKIDTTGLTIEEVVREIKTVIDVKN